MPMTRHAVPLAGLAAGLALIAVAAPAVAQDVPHDFRGVEFLNSDARLPAARALVARAAPQGSSMADARRGLIAAGTRCGERDAGGAMTCEFTMAEHNVGEPMRDIVWSVRLVPDAGGRVATTSIVRDIYGV